MAVIKANVQSEFVVVSNKVAQDSRLSLEARGMVLLMGSRPAGWKFNKAELMQNAGVGRDKLNRIFSELINFGHLAVVQNHDESGRFVDADYHFFTESSQNPAFIEAEPCTEKPYTENPCNGKSAPINKESLEKKDLKQNGHQKNVDRAFDFFWSHYPKKAGKQKAISAFKKLMVGKSEKSIIELTETITNYMLDALDDLSTGNTRFLGYDNMNASTYINQQRWNDE